MFHIVHMLQSYNHTLNDLILTNCICYQKYYIGGVFDETVIDQRKSYMACVCYKSGERSRTRHVSIPIILGTYIDFLIRGKSTNFFEIKLWGLMILNGVLKMYANFSSLSKCILLEKNII